MPKYHSPEYLEEAVKLVVEVGHPLDYVAEKLSIPKEQLVILIERNRSDPESPARNGENKDRSSEPAGSI